MQGIRTPSHRHTHTHTHAHTPTHTLPALTADEAGGFEDLFLLLFLTPQIRKSIDNDTKNEVEDNDDDNEIEQQVVDHTGSKQRLLFRKGKRIELF